MQGTSEAKSHTPMTSRSWWQRHPEVYQNQEFVPPSKLSFYTLEMGIAIWNTWWGYFQTSPVSLQMYRVYIVYNGTVPPRCFFTHKNGQGRVNARLDIFVLCAGQITTPLGCKVHENRTINAKRKNFSNRTGRLFLSYLRYGSMCPYCPNDMRGRFATRPFSFNQALLLLSDMRESTSSIEGCGARRPYRDRPMSLPRQ